LNIGNTKIKFLIKYTFYVIDIVKKDKCCDFNPNVESRVVLRQPVIMFFVVKKEFTEFWYTVLEIEKIFITNLLNRAFL